MEIVSGKELGFYPNGTVFAQIDDKYFLQYPGDMDLRGLMILDGHDEYTPRESGKFNGVMYMNDSVPVEYNEDMIPCVDQKRASEIDNLNTLVDTADYDVKDEWFVVYNRKEVKTMIDNLQWALKGCKKDEFKFS